MTDFEAGGVCPTQRGGGGGMSEGARGSSIAIEGGDTMTSESGSWGIALRVRIYGHRTSSQNQGCRVRTERQGRGVKMTQ
jgi:hypothetical protein